MRLTPGSRTALCPLCSGGAAPGRRVPVPLPRAAARLRTGAPLQVLVHRAQGGRVRLPFLLLRFTPLCSEISFSFVWNHSHFYENVNKTGFHDVLITDYFCGTVLLFL